MTKPSEPLNYDAGAPTPEPRVLRYGISPWVPAVGALLCAAYSGMPLSGRGKMHPGEAGLTAVLLWFSLLLAVITVAKVVRRRGPYYRWSRHLGIGLLVPWAMLFVGTLVRFLQQIDRWR